jgi:NAD(P)H-flavin reductase
VFSGMIPLGHFTLRDTSNNKCFIGTGTGFAPLYCQMLASSMSENKPEKVAFIFWVRDNGDTFYKDEITTLGERFSDFTSVPYLSRWDLPGYEKGYVTDWITNEHIRSYEEFYLCGSPAMVKSAREKLEALGVMKEQIFWEQY